MEEINQQYFVGERAMFQTSDTRIVDSIFEDGESQLRHSRNLEIDSSFLKGKYPLWYSENVKLIRSVIVKTAGSAVWSTNNVFLENTVVEAPKCFRRCNGVSLKNVNFIHASETMWNCSGITMEKVIANGDYFAMNSRDIKVDSLSVSGSYCFDGVKNAEINNGRFLSRKAFWNCENIIIRNSFISGELLGWDSKNITFENCTIESSQGLCFVENLVMRNCKIINTTNAFEYSSVDIEATTRINSIKNPWSGVIRAKSIGEIILDNEHVDTSQTKIICEE